MTELVAANVISTVPEATLDAVADHGQVRGDTIRGTYAESRQVLDELAELGIDYDEVMALLEEQGIITFDQAWARAAAHLAHRMEVGPR